MKLQFVIMFSYVSGRYFVAWKIVLIKFRKKSLCDHKSLIFQGAPRDAILVQGFQTDGIARPIDCYCSLRGIRALQVLKVCLSIYHVRFYIKCDIANRCKAQPFI
jgi:hypothetical protein